MVTMKVSSEQGYIDRLLPTEQIQKKGNNTTQVEKTRDVTPLLSDTRPISANNNNQQVIYNNVNGSSMLQVANDSLEEIRGGLQELKALSLKVSTTSTSDLSNLQNHADDIVAGIQDLLESTKFGGEPLLTENANHTIITNNEIENAIKVITYDVENELESTGLYSLNVNDPENINRSLQAIDDSMDIINLISSQYTAQQRVFNHNIDNVFESATTTSKINHQDHAQTISNQVINDIANHASLSVQAQANITNEKSLNLLTK